ncbi:MAG: isoleucine--tRNA ligase, partial [Candidatus Margulisbacteria bacterium]|nr:isoleucine--tRNA ligase [Candidatus Margulisiibacteriota bacterium]
DNPYLTINYNYEAKVIELFGDLAEKGYIHRGLKPIHWCPHCETALAEAEIEYEDERSPSIFVKFQISNDKCQMKDINRNPHLPLDLPWYLVIWTTTPWTLPANVAIAAHPEYEYVLVKTGKTATERLPAGKAGRGLPEERGNREVYSQVSEQQEEIYIVAEGLLEKFVEKLGLKEHKIIDKVPGKNLEGIKYKHAFLEREGQVVLDTYVTLEQGTGLVHIAPGHGDEDYKVGLKYKLPIVMPVDERGHFDDSVPEFIRGKFYAGANKIITQKMQEDGSLLKIEFMKHPYPHCWRCKKSVIFRATEQWFVIVSHKNMRAEALKAIKQTKWFPAWGENRIRGMVETRPDWCISRQRSWGVPIPVFYCKECKKPMMTGKFNKAIVDLVKQHGTNAWFEKTVEEILPKGTECSECRSSEFIKEKDILDVWFESGSSHAAVLEQTAGFTWPADLYLEGSDQHRGWFQTSLLLGIGHKGKAPFKAVLTHGFTIDDKGKKMSKSLGNVISPQEVVKEYGADILRLWVASTDFRNDMAASKNILKQVQEAYLKIRNTCRFLLSNLGNPEDCLSKPEAKSLGSDGGKEPRVSLSGSVYLQYGELLEIDKWILLKLQRLIERVTKAYDNFEFHIVYHALYDFCVSDLSAYYLDMSKDRLYCDGKDSISRKSAQFAMGEILLTLIKLMAPVLSFTAEDILRYIMKNVKCRVKNDGSVFLLDFPKVDKKYLDEKLEAKWEKILALREEVYRVIEQKRSAKEIASSVEALVEIGLKGREWLKDIEKLLPMVMIVSQIKLVDGEAITVRKAAGKKCVRCWMWKESVGSNLKHPELCERCNRVVQT